MRKQTINEVLEQKAIKKKRSRKRVKRLVVWIKSIFLLALALAVVIFTGLSPLFYLTDMEVKGSIHYDHELLKGYTGIQLGENGFKQIGSNLLNIISLRFREAEAVIMKNCPYIETVRVRYSLPSKVVISVTERTAEFSVPYLGTSLLIDRSGYVLEVLPADSEQTYISIMGLEFKDYELGSKLELNNPEAFENSLKLMEILKESDRIDKSNILEKVNAIDASDESNLKITLENRVVVNFGSMKDINYKISTAKIIFTKNIKKGERGILNFTTGPNPVFSPESGG